MSRLVARAAARRSAQAQPGAAVEYSSRQTVGTVSDGLRREQQDRLKRPCEEDKNARVAHHTGPGAVTEQPSRSLNCSDDLRYGMIIPVASQKPNNHGNRLKK